MESKMIRFDNYNNTNITEDWENIIYIENLAENIQRYVGLLLLILGGTGKIFTYALRKIVE